MNVIFNPEGAGNTALSPEDAAQLMPALATREDLNEWERQNILAAHVWAFSKRVMFGRDPLDEIYIRDLHRKMFDKTWKWAGVYRKTDLNFGCPVAEIYQRIPFLLGNVREQIAKKVFEIDEIAVRFHHQLVCRIHPFPNGNGRHARMIADVLAVKRGRPAFTWGQIKFKDTGASREAYLSAMRALDANDKNVGALLEFARQ
jgi:Fic-DOC domain mobile mystery protein B